MAANDRSIERLKARREAGITEAVAEKLQILDGVCGEKAGYVESLCRAIEALAMQDGGAAPVAHRLTIANLAQQAAYWSSDFGNELNCFAEQLGCNDLSQRGAA